MGWLLLLMLVGGVFATYLAFKVKEVRTSTPPVPSPISQREKDLEHVISALEKQAAFFCGLGPHSGKCRKERARFAAKEEELRALRAQTGR